MKRSFVLLILLAILSLLLTVPVSAANDTYVVDETGILGEEYVAELNELAQKFSELRECGIYLLLMDDLADYPDCDTFEAAIEVYHGEKFGLGDDRSGVILLFSREDRECSTFIYGETAEYAIDEYGAIQLEDAYYSSFKTFFDNDDADALKEGCRDYIMTCGNLLNRAAIGNPVRKPTTGPTVFGFLIAIVISGLICLGLVSKMKNVKLQKEAAAYAVDGGLKLVLRSDTFVNRTVTRKKLDSGSSGGSSAARSGGGGHGRTSKF